LAQRKNRRKAVSRRLAVAGAFLWRTR
jgi:hypothetical protein